MLFFELVGKRPDWVWRRRSTAVLGAAEQDDHEKSKRERISGFPPVEAVGCWRLQYLL